MSHINTLKESVTSYLSNGAGFIVFGNREGFQIDLFTQMVFSQVNHNVCMYQWLHNFIYIYLWMSHVSRRWEKTNYTQLSLTLIMHNTAKLSCVLKLSFTTCHGMSKFTGERP